MLSRAFYCAGKEYSAAGNFIPAPYFRKTFYVNGRVEKGSLTVGCLGFYRVFLNGRELTRGHISPFVSNLDDYIYYDEYSLRAALVEGKNVIAFVLGNGLRNCMGGYSWNFTKAPWRGSPAVAFRMEFADDEDAKVVESDGTIVTCPSPILMDDLRYGETYDATKEIKGWNTVSFDDSGWKPAVPADVPRGESRIGMQEPIVAEQELKPVEIRPGRIDKQRYDPDSYVIPYPEDEHGTEGYLYDFGENNAGIVKLHIKGERGQKVILQFGELLTKQGGLNLSNMAYAPLGYDHRIVYICKGGAEGEDYSPSFTYFGFRYVLVMGITPEQAVPELLTAVVMHTKCEILGGVSSSDEVLNKLYMASRRANLSNYFHIITDCPHREKNGWTGDIALSAEQMLLSMNPENNLREWLNNVRKAQIERGLIPDIIPTAVNWGMHETCNPWWNRVLVDVPFFIWKYRGDTEILKENATAIFRLVDMFARLQENSEDGLLNMGFGDWCPFARVFYDYPCAEVITSTFGVIETLRRAEMIFDELGMKGRALYTRDARKKLTKAADAKLINHETHTVLGNTQTGQAIGLMVGMFPPEEEQAAADVLVKLIHDNDDLLTIGVLGSRYIYEALSSHGYTDLALEVLLTERYPSMGYAVTHGHNTALPESIWEFDTQGDPGSQNHHFFGDFAGWYVRELGGLKVNPSLRDVNNVNVEPRFGTRLEQFSCWHVLPAGKIEISWKRAADGITLSLTVPEGVHGDLVLHDGFTFEDGSVKKPLAGGEYRVK